MKKFLEEKKRQMKFKMAGPGHKLNETNPSDASGSKSNPALEKRVDTKENQEKRSAVLAAAMQRSLGGDKKSDINKKPMQKRLADEISVAEKRAMHKQITEEIQAAEKREEINMEADKNADHTTYGVFFKCPAIGNEVLTRDEWNKKIEHYINEMREGDSILSAILAIKSLNSTLEADECITLITIYLRNLVDYPDNDKYKSIRMGNPKFNEKVLRVKGALDFLLGIGFVKEDGDNSESYLVYRSETSPSDLELLIQSLTDISGFEFELDRDFQSLNIDDIVAQDNIALPDDFFEVTVADVRREHRQRALEAEKESMLRTSKMREMDKARNARRKPIYTRIRLRFPNSIIIQGTFSVKEPLKNLRSFIAEHVEIDSDYVFMSPPAHVYESIDEEKTFEELDLQPAVQLFLKTNAENIALKKVD